MTNLMDREVTRREFLETVAGLAGLGLLGRLPGVRLLEAQAQEAEAAPVWTPPASRGLPLIDVTEAALSFHLSTETGAPRREPDPVWGWYGPPVVTVEGTLRGGETAREMWRSVGREIIVEWRCDGWTLQADGMVHKCEMSPGGGVAFRMQSRDADEVGRGPLSCGLEIASSSVRAPHEPPPRNDSWGPLTGPESVVE